MEKYIKCTHQRVQSDGDSSVSKGCWVVAVEGDNGKCRVVVAMVVERGGAIFFL